MRTAAEKRHNDWKKAIRKRRIDRERDSGEYHQDYYDNLHQYSKNKIHCSCPLCRGLAKAGENNISDLRKLEEMKSQELEK